jgi:hypothetical protein
VVSLAVDYWIRRGRDNLQVVIAAAVDAADLTEALNLAWESFNEAAGASDDWDRDAPTAELRPG